jgi:hypothetical protein
MPLSGVSRPNNTINIVCGESMPGKVRIFWTTEEKNAVLAAARKVREQQPRSTLQQVGTRAQGTLPKQRRRPVNNKLTSWLSTALKSGSAVAARRPPAKVAKAVPSAAPRKPRAKGTKAAPPRPNMLQTLIEQGAAILSGILRHPSVRDALGSTLRRGRVSRKR